MGTIMCGRFWNWTERAVHNGSDPLLSASEVTGTASTPQVVNQRHSARSYGLGGIPADLPASRGASGRHSLLVWTKPGKEVRALALFFAWLRFPLAVGPSWPKAASAAGRRQGQLMSLGEGGGGFAKPEPLQPLTGSLDRIPRSPGLMREMLGQSLVSTPHRALHAWDVTADGLAFKLGGEALPGREILQPPWPACRRIAPAVVDAASQLIGKQGLDVLPELRSSARRGGHGAEFGQATGELLALEVDELGEPADQGVGIAGVADAAALLAAAPGGSQPEGGRQSVLAHNPDRGEEDREGDRPVMAGAAH